MAASPLILLIEDEMIVREPLADLLGRDKYQVIAVATGDEGLICLETELPDLILCDIMLPGISGYDVLKTVRTNPHTRQIPLLFLTARVEKQDVQRGMELGATGYLFKPVGRAALQEGIRKCLAKSPVATAVEEPTANPQPISALHRTGHRP